MDPLVRDNTEGHAPSVRLHPWSSASANVTAKLASSGIITGFDTTSLLIRYTHSLPSRIQSGFGVAALPCFCYLVVFMICL